MVKICEGFQIKDACEAYRHMDYTGVADYGREAYGHSLHTWDDGKRLLAKCKKCGGYLLIQYSEYHGTDDDYYVDYFPVGSPEEADEINRKYDGFALEFEFPRRFLIDTNGRLRWSRAWEDDLNIRDRLFQEDNMYLRMRDFALAEDLSETYQALRYISKQHAGQFRKPGKYTSEKVPYINHPLLMACQAHAFGIRDDSLLAAILLHDVVEDTGVDADEIPFSDAVKEIVRLVSFQMPDGETWEQARKEYYERIAQNGKACVVKIIDRCNNVSTMAGSFSRERMIEYIQETERYVLPLTDILKNNYIKYSDLAFLVKYQIISLLETIKNLIHE